MIVKLYIILIPLFFSVICSANANELYRVFMTDKGPEAFEIGSNIYNRTIDLHNERCLERRAKNIKNLPILTIADAPLYQAYLDSIEILGAEIYLKLRWNNYVVVKTDSVKAELISLLTFVSKIQKVSNKLIFEHNSIPEPIIDHRSVMRKESSDIYNTHTLDYGESLSQISAMDANILHGFGINGDGVLIGFLDSGFDWKHHSSLNKTNVIAEYDFIDNNNITANEEHDVAHQYHHGTLVLSSIVGKSNGNLIGIAPEAEVILAKTEDLKHERRIEEDAFAAGIEWMESQGVDILNASLTYRNYDPEEEKYDYTELIGWKTIAANSVNNAAERGVLCFISAGNNGPNPETIGTPADADSAITVGALLKNSLEPAEFSSRGPRSDGRIKPDLATMGATVYIANPMDSLGFMYINGTSLSSPLLAGGAALLLSIFPDATQYELKQMLINFAHLRYQPNNDVGFGQPDLYSTAFGSGAFISAPSYYRVGNYIRVQTTALPEFENRSVNLFVRFQGKANFEKYEMTDQYVPWIWIVDIPVSRFYENIAEAYIEIENNLNVRYPNRDDDYFDIDPVNDKIQFGLNEDFILKHNHTSTNAWLENNILESGKTCIVNVNMPEGGNIRIEVYDNLGRIVRDYSGYLNHAGYYTRELGTTWLLSGTYYIRIMANNTEKMLPLIILR